MSFRDSILFWATKNQALKNWKKGNYELSANYCNELSIQFSESFIIDSKMMQLLYDAIRRDDTFKLFVGNLGNIYASLPRKSIGQKNLMVMLRRVAVDHHQSEACELAKVLLYKNDPKSCLGSKHFMEMLICIASFDNNGSVTRMLDYLEQKEPELCGSSELFKEARASNIESLINTDEESIDLVEEHNNETQVDTKSSTLWAKPL